MPQKETKELFWFSRNLQIMENFLKLLFISAYFMRQKNMPQKYLTGRSRVAAFMLY